MNSANRFQFSIRMMLLATAAVAAVVGAVRVEPSWKSLVALECLTMSLATASVLLLRQATGTLRTFWIGVAMGHSMAFLAASHVIPWFVPYQHGLNVSEIEDYAAGAAQSLRYILPAIWCAAPINGLLAVGVQWIITRRPPENDR